MNKYFRMGLTVLAVFATAFINTAVANTTPYYQVELIIYSHINPTSINSESWPILNPSNFPLNSNAITLKPENGSTDAFSLLPTKNFKMHREASLLSREPGYKVIAHVAWRQKVFNFRVAQPVSLFAGWEKNGAHQIQGNIKVSRDHYLDTKLSLIFAEPLSDLKQLSKTNNFAQAKGELMYFRVSNDRRMRSNELNYIAHPLYGVLVKIFPVGSAEPDDHAAN